VLLAHKVEQDQADQLVLAHKVEWAAQAHTYIMCMDITTSTTGITIIATTGITIIATTDITTSTAANINRTTT
jgi:hypothetical protein